MAIRIPNALTQNTVMGRPFPVSVTSETRSGVATTWLCPIQAVDLIDLFVDGAGPWSFLYDVGIADYEQDEHGGWREVSLAASLPGGVTLLGDDSGNLLLRTADLVPTLEDLTSYNLAVVDVVDRAVELASLWCALHEIGADGEPVLLRLPASTRLLRSHDDCYAAIEARDATLGVRAIARLLSIAAATAIQREHGATSDVVEPASAIVEAALGAVGSLTLAQQAIEVGAHEVALPFARASWRLADPVPEPTHRLVFGVGTGSWQVHPL